jgi:hypothetical protein
MSIRQPRSLPALAIRVYGGARSWRQPALNQIPDCLGPRGQPACAARQSGAGERKRAAAGIEQRCDADHTGLRATSISVFPSQIWGVPMSTSVSANALKGLPILAACALLGATEARAALSTLIR